MRALLLAMLLATVAACGRRGPSTDSKSNWLHDCAESSECSSGLACICGLCTTECASSEACDRGAADETCVDPVRDGLPAACGLQSEARGERICLAACDPDTPCGPAQRCWGSICIAASLVVSATDLDASADARANAGTGGVRSIPPIRMDASTPPRPDDAGRPIRIFDSGTLLHDGGAVVTPDGGSPVDAGACLGIEDCCNRSTPCSPGLVCHYDETCVVPGETDTAGVATLAAPVPEDVALFAADDLYLYGTDMRAGPGALVRWPIAGGEGEVMAAGTGYFFEGDAPLVVDDDYLYFIARTSSSELTSTLWRVPVDGPAPDDDAPAVDYGPVGQFLRHDAQFLYFSNAGDSRVLRLRKDRFDPAARENMYTSESDAPNTIGGLAINSIALLIIEYAPQVPVPIAARRIDKASLQVTLIADQDRLLDVSFPGIFANDTYFVTITGGGFQRFELANLEMTPLATGWPTHPSLLGNEIYFASNGMVRRLDLAAARTDDLLRFYRARNVLASGAWIFAQVQTEDSHWSLVRIDRE